MGISSPSPPLPPLPRRQLKPCPRGRSSCLSRNGPLGCHGGRHHRLLWREAPSGHRHPLLPPPLRHQAGGAGSPLPAGSPPPAPTLTQKKRVLTSASGIGRWWHGLRRQGGQSLPAAIILNESRLLARASPAGSPPCRPPCFCTLMTLWLMITVPIGQGVTRMLHRPPLPAKSLPLLRQPQQQEGRRQEGGRQG